METNHIRHIIHRLPGKVIHHVPLPHPDVTEGQGAREKVGELCSQYGYKHALLVTDQTLHRLGYDRKIEQSLSAAGVAYALYADINSEPTVALIDAGREAAKNCQADCIIALGGGSVMDTCKMIAAGAKMPHFKTQTLLQKFLVVPGNTLPLITIPSTAGTGAEITVGAVVTNNRGKKGSTVVIGLEVAHVILDSELTLHAPVSVTAACGMDALSHCIEGAVGDVEYNEEDMNKSLEGAKLIFRNLPLVLKEPENSEARLCMCRAAMYGGNAINTQLAGYVHAFAHSIGAKYHLSHGNAITLCMLPVLEYQKEVCLSKYAMIARYCGIASGDTNDSTAADLFLKAVEKLIKQCGLDKLALPVQKEDYAALTRMVVADSINYSAPKTFSQSDIHNILQQLTK